MNLRTLLRSTLSLLCLAVLAAGARAENNPRLYAVEVSASVQASPPRIVLNWPSDPNASGYSVYRKSFTGTSWTLTGNLAGSATTWTDLAVVDGATYEYSVQKTTSVGYKGTGYIYAGINAPPIESRGKMLLIVDKTHSTALAAELARLQFDLVGDGWTVIRHDVARTDSAPTVKNLIRNAYNSDPGNVKSVFLFGHVAVPYSGNLNPDGHPDHKGAWVADTYYGDVDGSWTDSSVNNASAEKPWNDNVPGDGKFDQSEIPSDIELAVGRVDFYNMTCFANKTPSRSELDLLRAYLNKHHAFRHGQINLPRRGLVSDNFGERSGEAFAATGWRNFAPFFGAQNNVAAPAWTYFNTLKDSGYLWSYGTGGGSWYTCDGVGSSDDFARTDIKSVFTTYLGSYFGDWDNESAFLRASLGSGYVLATAWGGRPHWFFHHMALGETIGHSAKITQNNRYGGLYSAQNYGTRGTHVTLLGDPTLRMHPVAPSGTVTATLASGVALAWTASPDPGVHGYVVYRGASEAGPFTRVSGGNAVGLGFTDPSGTSSSVYMVRAVKIETSGSGTYYNLSQGIFAKAGGTITAPTTPTSPTTTTPTPSPTTPSTASSVTFVKQDSGTSGTWKGIYGASGRVIHGDATSYPAGVSGSASGASTWIWQGSTTDGRALQKSASNDRIASCWYSSKQFDLRLTGDSQTRRLSIYCLDFDRAARQQTIELYDLASGQVLDIRQLSSFGNGVWLTYDIKGSVGVRAINKGAVNAVISGLFFDGGSTTTTTTSPTTTTTTSPTSTTSPTTTAGTSGTSVTALGVNTTVKGTWMGVYGKEGYVLQAERSANPSYGSVSYSGKADHVWVWNSTDAAALQKSAGTDRLAACWYASESFEIKVNLTDGKKHKVSFYCLDWDRQNRSQKIEVLDGATGAILHTQTLNGYQTGAYVSYDVSGNLRFRFTRSAGHNAVVSGVFFDAPSAP